MAYLPPWINPETSKGVVEEWTEEVISGPARGIGHFVKFLNKKNKPVEMMKWVIWEDKHELGK
jgi:hypothetical protein